VVDGVVYAGSTNGYLYAVNSYSGKLLWSFQTGGPIDSSPAVVDGIVYFGSWDGNVYAVNVANHAKLWSYSTGDHVICSAAVANGVVYIGSEDNNFYALHAINGSKLWSYTVENVIYSSPVVVDSVVYFGDGNGNVLALDAVNGTQIWCYTTVGLVNASPAIVNGIVYIATLRGPQQYGINTIPTLYALTASSTPGPFKTMHTRPLPTIQPTPTSSPNPTATPPQSPMPTSQATPKPTIKPSPTPPSSSVMAATTENGTTLFLELSGNITESQISKAMLTVNRSATTTTLSFNLNGQSGTVGFSNITIQKGVLTGLTPKILIDNQLAQNQGFTQDALNYYVWYTAHFSSHQIAIIFSADTLPTPTSINESLEGQISWTQIIFGLLGALVIVIVIIGVLVLVNRERHGNR